MSKLSEAKQNLNQIKTNFGKEAISLVESGSKEASAEDDLGETETKEPVFSLAKKKENIHKLESKAAQIKKKLPLVHQLEVDLGLPNDV